MAGAALATAHGTDSPAGFQVTALHSYSTGSAKPIEALWLIDSPSLPAPSANITLLFFGKRLRLKILVIRRYTYILA